MNSRPLVISGMSPEEQLRLVEQLWDNLSKNPDGIPITQAQRDELDRRIAETDADGGSGIPWDEVQRRIRERRG